MNDLEYKEQAPGKLEVHLVDGFEALIMETDGPWGSVQLTREFDYGRGRTDVVLLLETGQLVAVEAKLTRWREALHQAYRNLCFANYSYVLLPKSTAARAHVFETEFSKRGVGICCIEGGELSIILEAPPSEPLQTWLHEKAYSRIAGVIHA